MFRLEFWKMLLTVWVFLAVIALGGWILAGYLQSWYYRWRTRRFLRAEIRRMDAKRRPA